ncbi:hypothetical protein CIB48_g10410 [Xylaria polymorpha]|nr:hypothetical protein CIB48_g10410 [Xylaria polymorpha]
MVSFKNSGAQEHDADLDDSYVAITSRFLLAIFIQLTTTLSSRSLQLAHGLQYDVELEDGHIGIIDGTLSALGCNLNVDKMTSGRLIGNWSGVNFDPRSPELTEIPDGSHAKGLCHADSEAKRESGEDQQTPALQIR